MGWVLENKLNDLRKIFPNSVMVWTEKHDGGKYALRNKGSSQTQDIERILFRNNKIEVTTKTATQPIVLDASSEILQFDQKILDAVVHSKQPTYKRHDYIRISSSDEK